MNHGIVRFWPLFALLSALLAGPPGATEARAAATPWLDHEQAQVRLIAAQGAVGEADSLSLGLQFKLQPGWKIYWRSPGDAGFPPSLDWSASENLADAAFSWPVPYRFSLFGLETFGYAEEVVLPIEARLDRPGEAVSLRAALRYLICEEICIPYDGELVLSLPAGSAAPARETLLIEQYRARVPGDGSAVGLSLESAALGGSTEAPVLEVAARSERPFEAPDLLVEAPPGYSFGKPEVRLAEEGRLAHLRLASLRGPAAEGVVEGKRLTLTLTDGRRGLETQVVARFAEPPAGLLNGTAPLGSAPGAAAPSLSLATILALALLGGLILNLMPCVLPVLSIKLLSVVSHGGSDKGPVRIGFLASAAGILFSFLVLAGAAIALKSAGMAAGWGIQFQQPLFLSAMTAIVTLFALSLFGLFEIPLPGFLSGLAAVGGDRGPGQGGGGGDHSLLGHFLTGAFATLLATPCSAPFLGTAVGFALASGAAEILLVFVALGLGLSLPYLLIAAVPSLATALPRPGPWMVWLRRVLGLALLATAVWLLSVLAVQIGATGSLLAGALLAAVALAIALGRRTARTAAAGLALAVGLGAGLGAVALPLAFESRQPVASEVADQDWEPLDTGRIAALVAEGRVVLVDVTADWCITCQVNKRLVLDSATIRERLGGSGEVVAMRGDWTLPDPAITDYLASFGRYGIPFNAVYGPGLPNGEALPELLTVEAVLGSLARAEAADAPRQTASPAAPD